MGLVCGALVERRGRVRILRYAEKGLMFVLYLLLISMGLWVGLNDEVIAAFGRIGLEACILAFGALMGSLTLAPLAHKIMKPPEHRPFDSAANIVQESVKIQPLQGVRTTLSVLVSFLLGVLLGRFHVFSMSISAAEQGTTMILYLLLGIAGFTVGGERTTWKMVRQTRPRIFVLPGFIIVGSLIGSALGSLMLPSMSVRNAMSIGAGLGWYSLASVILAKLSSPAVGVVALIANMLREMVTLLFAPQLVRWFTPLGPIAAGGATTMDSTLPVITLFSGKEYAFISVFSGVVLNIVVPFLIPAVYAFAGLFSR